MKRQIPFSGKININFINLSHTEFAKKVVMVKGSSLAAVLFSASD